HPSHDEERDDTPVGNSAAECRLRGVPVDDTLARRSWLEALEIAVGEDGALGGGRGGPEKRMVSLGATWRLRSSYAHTSFMITPVVQSKPLTTSTNRAKLLRGVTRRFCARQLCRLHRASAILPKMKTLRSRVLVACTSWRDVLDDAF